MAYTEIDIGASAINRSGSWETAKYSVIAKDNPANAPGVLTSFEAWFLLAVTNETFHIGTLSQNAGDSTKFTLRDYELIGKCPAGSKQIFTGKNCDVATGDYVGIYWGTGDFELDIGTGQGNWYRANENAISSGSVGVEKTYSFFSARVGSFFGSGVTKPDAPAGVSATDHLTDKVTITWTKSIGAMNYRVYRSSDNNALSSVLGDVDTYDDTTAVPGTVYPYYVKAINIAGYSAPSFPDNGARVSPVSFVASIMQHHFIPSLGGY